jgi:hypothetical protein
MNKRILATLAALAISWVGVQAQTNLVAFGDSITFGNGSSNYKTTSYIALLARAEGLALTNLSAGGTTIPDEIPVIYAAPIGTNCVCSILTGYNDMRFRGTNATSLDHYAETLESALAWMGIPYSCKVRPWSAETNWVVSTAYGMTNAFLSCIDRTPLTISVTGTVACVEFIRPLTGGGSAVVDVDGLNPTNLVMGHGESTPRGTVFSSVPLIYSGLADGPHTISIHPNGDGIMTIGWSAGLNPSNAPMPLVFCGNCLRMPQSAYVQTNDAPNSRGSDEAVAEINQRILAICSRLASIGIPVWYVDASESFTPVIDNATDLIHPNDVGHQVIANAFRHWMDGKGTPHLVATQIGLSVYTQAGRPGTVQSSADLLNWIPYPGLDTFAAESHLNPPTGTSFFRAISE